MNTGAPESDPALTAWLRLGSEMRRIREMHRLSLQAVQAQTSDDRSNLAKWETGRRKIPEDAMRRLDDLYDTRGLLVTLREVVASIDHTSRVTPETDRGHDRDMDYVRRQILASLAALGTTAALPSLDNLRHLIGPDRVQDWEEIVWERALAFHTHPIPDLVKDLAQDVIDIQQNLQRLGPGTPTAASWQRINAQLLCLLARALGSAGHPRESRGWWNKAREAAEFSGDGQLLAYILSKQAVQGLYEHRPVPVLLNNADEALAAAEGVPCAGATMALAVQAQVRAMQGNRDGSLVALREQAQVFKLLPSSVRDDHDSAFGWPEERLMHTRSFATIYGSNMPNDDEAQRAALASYPESNARGRAQLRLHRALHHVRSGDIVAGLDLARDAVAELPEHDRTIFVRFDAEAVLTAVPQSLQGKQQQAAAVEYQRVLALPPDSVSDV
ncbi:hypothetical protein GCM10022419_033140 [Nonomuraea rosea]|uniref:HTH cro/C1-type domain-containing protein n=1 Tax=Nonomuraea rosea TaxID=638574 RepID=A0ABP6WFI7_9ACTN